MSEENKAVSGADGRVVRRRGLRCQVCTGCGLCPGVTGDSAANRPGKLHVLAEDALQGEALPITDWRGTDRRETARADIRQRGTDRRETVCTDVWRWRMWEPLP